jgi:hypothetical protein
MAHITIQISGVPLGDAELEALRTRLHDVAVSILGTPLRRDIHILLGHSPMVVGEIEGYMQAALAKAVWRIVGDALPAGIDPTNRGRVNIVFTPENEREEIMCEMTELRARVWECEAGVKRYGADSARSQALAAEIEALHAQISILEQRLNALQ